MGNRIASRKNDRNQETSDENPKASKKGWMNRIKRTHKWNQRLNYTLGLKALLVGAIYISSAEDECPWLPLLLTFLLAFGIFNISAVVFFHYLNSFKKIYEVSKNTKIYLRTMVLAVNIGFTAWGFFLLYNTKEEVTYHQCSAHSDLVVMNENYCEKSVYEVSMIIVWASAVACIIFALSLYVGLRTTLRDMLSEDT